MHFKIFPVKYLSKKGKYENVHLNSPYGVDPSSSDADSALLFPLELDLLSLMQKWPLVEVPTKYVRNRTCLRITILQSVTIRSRAAIGQPLSRSMAVTKKMAQYSSR